MSDEPTDDTQVGGADAIRAAVEGESPRAGLRVVGGTEAEGLDGVGSDDSGGAPPPEGPPDDGRDQDGPDEPTDDQRRALLDTTDLGMATRLAHYLGDELIFCDNIGWLRFDGQRFDSEDGKALAHRAVVQTLRDGIKRIEYPAMKAWFAPALEADMATLPEDEKAEARAAKKRASDQLRYLWAAARNLGNVKKQDSTLKQASVLKDFRVRFADLDANPALFNTPGGVLSLPLGAPHKDEDLMDAVESVTRRDVRPSDRLTRVALARPHLPRLPAMAETFTGRFPG